MMNCISHRLQPYRGTVNFIWAQLYTVVNNIAKAALAAGNAVVATGRNTDTVTRAVGKADDLLSDKLDVTRPEGAQSAVKAAIDRFGHIYVRVNNPGNVYAGFFAEITAQDVLVQI